MSEKNPTIAQIIEGANVSALMALHETSYSLFPDEKTDVLRIASGVAAYMGSVKPLSYAVGLGLNGPVSVGDVQKVLDFYTDHGMVPRVDISPYDDESLCAALREKNFRLHWFMNVLARPILPLEQFAPPSEGIIVREARFDEADIWTAITDEGFSDGSSMTEARRRFGQLFFHLAGSYPYLAEMNGEVAGAGSVAVIGEYGGLMTASVRPKFRRHGIHGALIQARLKKAQLHGCSMAGIFASPGSQSQHNAERQGFRLAYTKVALKAEGTEELQSLSS